MKLLPSIFWNVSFWVMSPYPLLLFYFFYSCIFPCFFFAVIIHLLFFSLIIGIDSILAGLIVRLKWVPYGEIRFSTEFTFLAFNPSILYSDTTIAKFNSINLAAYQVLTQIKTMSIFSVIYSLALFCFVSCSFLLFYLYFYSLIYSYDALSRTNTKKPLSS